MQIMKYWLLFLSIQFVLQIELFPKYDFEVTLNFPKNEKTEPSKERHLARVLSLTNCSHLFIRILQEEFTITLINSQIKSSPAATLSLSYPRTKNMQENILKD